MPFTAISYGVRPGHDDEIAEIFATGSFRRASSPVMRDADGTELGRILATGLFIQDTDMVRVIQFQGDPRAIGRHMASQPGVHEAEQRIAPYLAVPRDTSTEAGFQAHFGRSVMRCVQQHVRRDDVATAMLAERHLVEPSDAESVAQALAAEEPVSAGTGPVIASAAFLRGRTLVRVYQYVGEVAAAQAYLRSRPGDSGQPAGPTGVPPMRCISQLSVLSLPPEAPAV